MSVTRILTDGLSIINNGAVYDTGEVNAYLDNYYWDNWSYFQRKFQPYGIMKLNKKLKYTVTQFKAKPLMLQKLEGCTYQNGCLVTEMRQELTPDLSYAKCSWCWDEYLDSAFEHVLDINNNGTIDLDAHGEKRFTLMTEEIFRNFGLSVRGNLAMGDFHLTSNFEFKVDSSAEERLLFNRTTTATKGWVTLQKEYATTYGAAWLDRPEDDVVAYDDTKMTLNGYSGNVAAILDELHRTAPDPLQEVINEGPQEIGGGRVVRPFVKVSSVWYNAIIREYNTESENPVQNKRTWTREIEGNNTVYYFRGQYPVMKVTEATFFDQFTSGKTNYIGWDVTGNVQIGGNFDEVPSKGMVGLRPGIIIQKDTNIHSNTYNHWGMLSHVLAKAAITDTKMTTAMISYSKEDTANPGTLIVV